CALPIYSRCRKLSAVRSAARIDAAGPSTSISTPPGSTWVPSGRRTLTVIARSTRRNTSRATLTPEMTSGSRATTAAAAGPPSPSSTHALVTSRSEEHTSELQSRENLVCRLLLEKKKKYRRYKRLMTAQKK